MESFDHIICPGLSILFNMSQPIRPEFENFNFDLEAFLNDFKIDCILVWQ